LWLSQQHLNWLSSLHCLLLIVHLCLLACYLPCLPAAEPSLKLLEEGDFMRAWGGIAGLQYALPATWHPWQQAGMNLTLFAQVGQQREAGRGSGDCAGVASLCTVVLLCSPLYCTSCVQQF
jgi:hypothetical protein